LLILPAIKAIFAAYHLKVPGDISAGEPFNFLSILGLNEFSTRLTYQRRCFSGMAALI
jgi:hypothetical protein